MKTRGWLLALSLVAAFIMTPTEAKATEAADMLDRPDVMATALWGDIASQEDIVLYGTDGDGAGSVAGNHNITNPKQQGILRQSMIGSSDGAFLPQVAATYAEEIEGDGSAATQAYETIFGTTSVGARDALALADSMTGVAGTAGANSGLETAQYNSSIVHNRQEALRRDMRLSCFDPCGNFVSGFANRIWATPFHNSVTQRNKDDYSGYKYKMTGVALGFERLAGPLAFGAAFTYSRGDYEWRDTRDDNKIHNYGGSLYAQLYTQSGFFAAFDGGFNYGKNKWNRYLGAMDTPGGYNGWERSKNHTNSYWVGGTVGFDAKLSTGAGNFTLTPTVGLYWYEAKSSAFSTGFDGDTHDFINYGKITKKSLLLPVEVTASYDHRIDDCSSISVKATGGYTYNFKNKGATGWADYGDGYGNQFGVTGMKSARHGWNVGAGMNYNYKNVDFGVNYRYEGAKEYRNHSVSATIGVRF